MSSNDRAAAGFPSATAPDRAWITEIDPALTPDRGPLQVLSTKRGGNGKGS